MKNEREYKAADARWFDTVPSDWELMPCRAIVVERCDKNDGMKSDSYLSLMANVGIIPYEEKGDIGNKKPDDLEKCKIVERGDLVINSMNYGIGSFGLSQLNGVCSPVYIVLRPKADVVEERFALRLFECKDFQTFAQSFGNGILAHRAAINWDILKILRMPVPQLQEQKQILEYLDRETAKIDALVEEQRRLIELLKEKRQAVISHAVTKGLDPSAPMKDSGVEWLGEVPAHWVVCKLGHLGKLQGGVAFPSDAFQADGVPVIRMNNLSRGGLNLEGASCIDPLICKETVALRVGDLLWGMSGSIGETGSLGNFGRVQAKDLPLQLNQRVGRFIPVGQGLDLNFMEFLVQSRAFSEQVTLAVTGTAQFNISSEQVQSCCFAWPPATEQAEITGFLKTACADLNALSEAAISAVALLQERRAALISAAVTGKIDVRELVSADTEAA